MASGVTEVREQIACGECFKEITPGAFVLERGMAFCPHCGARACRICGCTDHNACPEGCAWSADDPEVCDSHEGEV